MADKYTIQIQPQISPSDAKQMENDLNKRFGNVAKKFGAHVGTSLKSAAKSAAKYGLGALAAGVAAAVITNPFEKVNEDLNHTLEKADNLATRAAQFGVSTGKFAQLASVASSVGLDVDLALQQFASLRDEAKQFAAGDKTKNNALANFTSDKDVIDSFYAFIKTMQSLDPEQRNTEVSRVYGDKMGLKIAELLQQDVDLRKKQVLGRYSVEQIGNANDLLAKREDQQALLKAQRENDEAVMKSRAISSGTIKSQNAVEKSKIGTQTQQLSEYQLFAQQTLIQEKMVQSLDGIRADIKEILLPTLTKLVDYLKIIVDWTREKLDKVKNWSIFK